MKASIDEIKKYLNINENIEIEIIDSTESTNEDMKIKARRGKDEIAVLIAEKQTKGKGSKGRSFYSPHGTGIYMSLLLRPNFRPDETTLLTTMTAVALSQAIDKVTKEKSQIKWVNDIYIGGKKVAGILTEGAFKSEEKIDYAIVGIGINLAVPDEGFPEEIKNIAGALGQTKIINELIGEIINHFHYYYRRLPDSAYVEQYRKRLFFLGKEIKVINHEVSYKATALDIDDKCRLIVKKQNGEILTLNSGDISVKI